GKVVHEAEKVLGVGRVGAGIEVVGAVNGDGRLVVVLRRTVDIELREGKGRVGSGVRADAVIAHANLIEKVVAEDVIVGQRGHDVVAIDVGRSARHISATFEVIDGFAERGKKAALNGVL